MKKKSMMFLIFFLLAANAVFAYKGLSVATSFPSMYVSDTDMIVFDLRVKGYDLPPQRVNLNAESIPAGWEHVFVGGGGLVDAVFIEPDKEAEVQLWIEPAADADTGSYEFLVKAAGEGTDASFELPLTVRIGQEMPQRLSLDPELPSVRGTPKTDFTFNLTLTNNSASEVLVNLDAMVPEGFQASFSKKYGNASISTIPVDAGKSEDIKMEVSLPQGVSAGTYPVQVTARSEAAQAVAQLTMDIEGQPKLSVSGAGGLLSGSAVAGKEKAFTVIVENTGTAAAENIEFSSYKPANWEVTFDPDSLTELAAGEEREIQAVIKPSSEAITGDYNVTLRANSDQGNASEKFRITVKTSTMWGIVAVLIIAAAAVVLVLAVRKFGRR